MSKTYFLIVLVLWAVGACSPSQPQKDPFVAELRSFEERSGGQMGFACLDLATGRSYEHRGKARFAMASVYKVPIALTALQQAQAGRLSLSDSVLLSDEDLRWGYSPLREAILKGARHRYSYQELLEAMVLRSDNTASDQILSAVGGPAGVTQALRAQGLADIRVDRSEQQMHADLYQLQSESLAGVSYQDFLQQIDQAAPAALRQGFQRFLQDERDTATPLALRDLLQQFYAGKWLDSTHQAYLHDLMVAAPVRNSLIKAGVPDGARVAHKSGGLFEVDGVNGAENDIALIYLPDRPAPIILCILLKGSTLDRAARSAWFQALTRRTLAVLSP